MKRSDENIKTPAPECWCCFPEVKPRKLHRSWSRRCVGLQPTTRLGPSEHELWINSERPAESALGFVWSQGYRKGFFQMQAGHLWTRDRAEKCGGEEAGRSAVCCKSVWMCGNNPENISSKAYQVLGFLYELYVSAEVCAAGAFPLGRLSPWMIDWTWMHH